MFLEDDIRELSKRNELKRISGVGYVIEKLIKEIIETRRCSYYEKLLYFN